MNMEMTARMGKEKGTGGADRERGQGGTMRKVLSNGVVEGEDGNSEDEDGRKEKCACVRAECGRVAVGGAGARGSSRSRYSELPWLVNPSKFPIDSAAT